MKYVVTLFTFIAGGFALSWCCVYSFWIAAQVFHSVKAIRIGDAIGSIVLLPARSLMDQSLLLTNPLLYAMANGALIGILAYACCRQWIFGKKSGG